MLGNSTRSPSPPSLCLHDLWSPSALLSPTAGVLRLSRARTRFSSTALHTLIQTNFSSKAPMRLPPTCDSHRPATPTGLRLHAAFDVRPLVSSPPGQRRSHERDRLHPCPLLRKLYVLLVLQRSVCRLCRPYCFVTGMYTERPQAVLRVPHTNPRSNQPSRVAPPFLGVLRASYVRRIVRCLTHRKSTTRAASMIGTTRQHGFGNSYVPGSVTPRGFLQEAIGQGYAPAYHDLSLGTPASPQPRARMLRACLCGPGRVSRVAAPTIHDLSATETGRSAVGLSVTALTVSVEGKAGRRHRPSL
ncbi:hypothetical protein L226DRAFT_273419 [Lentinus tigrinus ALCF2SS1-7]|uniref:Uncharacterized protein n=1 Tax=Lentinus tigrinus ALCF2SS1-6 TaxID=1328759 RepID=A0A5C2S917_9APHY|nr:hypothetical protein L227DRAFT_98531 [Lentinus tigrinus ALCF2SS1-6]RPD69582.1 hypothetical protein L226DRAFT_273419 [Lentinus tigrinus ALCF2SS1-7]